MKLPELMISPGTRIMPNMKDVRRHQLGLILIGACLNGDETREMILSTLSEFAVNDGWVKECLRAIADGDRDGVYGTLTRLGVHLKDGQMAVDGVIDRLNELHEQEALEATMQMILKSGELDTGDKYDTAEKRLEGLLALVRSQRDKTFKAQSTFREHKDG